jgi:hypothetical protein
MCAGAKASVSFPLSLSPDQLVLGWIGNRSVEIGTILPKLLQRLQLNPVHAAILFP